MAFENYGAKPTCNGKTWYTSVIVASYDDKKMVNKIMLMLS